MAQVPTGYAVIDGNRRRVSAFRMDLRPVTNLEYGAFARDTGHKPPRWMHQVGFSEHDQPVVGVTYDDAKAYARWANKRLPTISEWMRAARADATWLHPWGDNPPDMGRCDYAASGRRAPDVVNPLSRPLGRGPFGHHDMLGCVWEWCADGVLCGGFFGAKSPTLEERLTEPASRQSTGYGFRCVR